MFKLRFTCHPRLVAGPPPPLQKWRLNGCISVGRFCLGWWWILRLWGSRRKPNWTWHLGFYGRFHQTSGLYSFKGYWRWAQVVVLWDVSHTFICGDPLWYQNWQIFRKALLNKHEHVMHSLKVKSKRGCFLTTVFLKEHCLLENVRGHFHFILHVKCLIKQSL